MKQFFDLNPLKQILKNLSASLDTVPDDLQESSDG
jgi:hypothetical protein